MSGPEGSRGASWPERGWTWPDSADGPGQQAQSHLVVENEADPGVVT
jgi:hypothetical protein